MFSPIGPYAGLGRFATAYPASPGQTLGGAHTAALLQQQQPGVAYYPRVQGLVHPSLYTPSLHMQSLCRQLTSGGTKDAEKDLKQPLVSTPTHYSLLFADHRPLHGGLPLPGTASPRGGGGEGSDCGLDLSHRGAGPRSPGAASDRSSDSPNTSPLSFSIDSILHGSSSSRSKRVSAEGGAGSSSRGVRAAREAARGEEGEWGAGTEEEDREEDSLSGHKYSWLQCTRYKPPKLPRSKKKEGGKKRKLGRNPRVPFTQHQVVMLEQKFRHTHYLSSVDVAELSAKLNLTETRVKIWFQNRRARERRDRDGCLQSGPTGMSGTATGTGSDAHHSPGAPGGEDCSRKDPGSPGASPLLTASSIQCSLHHTTPYSDYGTVVSAAGSMALHARGAATDLGAANPATARLHSAAAGKALALHHGELADPLPLSWHAKSSAFTPVMRLPS